MVFINQVRIIYDISTFPDFGFETGEIVEGTFQKLILVVKVGLLIYYILIDGVHGFPKHIPLLARQMMRINQIKQKHIKTDNFQFLLNIVGMVDGQTQAKRTNLFFIYYFVINDLPDHDNDLFLLSEQ